MGGCITWGVTPAPDGSPLRTVFCLDCREVFARYLTGIDHMDVQDKAEKEHQCKAATAQEQNQ